MITASWYTGKRALVTGASSGIGLAMAELLADRGARVLLCGRDTERIEVARRRIEGHLWGPGTLAADLARPDGAEKLIKAVNALGQLPQIVINSAGFNYFGETRDMAPGALEAMVHVLAQAPARLSLAFLEAMEGGVGGVLNVASVCAFFPTPGSTVYGASKQFLRGFTDGLHTEMRPYGVRVTGLYPGNTHSRFLEQATNGRHRAWTRAMTPEFVATAGLDGLARGARRVFPGWGDRARALASGLLPTAFLAWRTFGHARRYGQTKR